MLPSSSSEASPPLAPAMSLWRNQLLNHLTAELVEIGGNRRKGKVYIRWKGWVWIRYPTVMPNSGRDGIGNSDLKEVVAIGSLCLIMCSVQTFRSAWVSCWFK
ncbi:G-type lectin S-receptor-like serine/threonine-protein kinase [Pyrus ussuriensis x Pyrus communis]|uniref:G-type lectin S-receptor-like serine/threonine-protein kinase n=1 Tax=Pyrus ussuriensis x Pyrus communis TaxID=2448454 RepID=A0A5N5G2H0_9ROSA|nr:G-type lectin S-receptor-like serine/threonine-protein kinase [Pyrus ussuriensis x Pyrus communis]